MEGRSGECTGGAASGRYLPAAAVIDRSMDDAQRERSRDEISKRSMI
jgi:hypothetical protein